METKAETTSSGNRVSLFPIFFPLWVSGICLVAQQSTSCFFPRIAFYKNGATSMTARPGDDTVLSVWLLVSLGVLHLCARLGRFRVVPVVLSSFSLLLATGLMLRYDLLVEYQFTRVSGANFSPQWGRESERPWWFERPFFEHWMMLRISRWMYFQAVCLCILSMMIACLGLTSKPIRQFGIKDLLVMVAFSAIILAICREWTL